MDNQQLAARLDQLLLNQQWLLKAISAKSESRQEWFSPKEFANLVNRRPYTVRAWCRKGVLTARKRPTRRGRTFEWEIPNSELLRYRNHGLSRSTNLDNQRSAAI